MKNFQKLITVILVAVFLLTTFGPSSNTQANLSQRLHPLLLQAAARNPDQLVTVIVRKGDAGSAAESEASRLGGQITRRLNIINAFVVTLPARAAQQLAANPAVAWVTPDAAVERTACTGECVSAANLKNAYIKTVRADKVWALANAPQGKGIGVAVVDSGINWQADLYTVSGQNRVIENVRFNTDYNQTTFDNFGHGSHVAGVIGGNGRSSNGSYIGVAPQASIINVKVSNDDGSATASSVVQGLEWVLDNKDAYNIRVVNLSLNSSVAESYHTSPLDAAVEVLWFNGVVVVVAAGNNGTAKLFPPANDPFVITVGAVDEKGTAVLTDDVIPSFSAYGTTEGFNKPDLVAPGKNIISLMGNASGSIPAGHPANKLANGYFSMSGTSVSAPIVSGVVALLLEDEPNLTPDQVKYRLKSTANKAWTGFNGTKAGAGIIDALAAVKGTSTASANTGLKVSQLLGTGSEPIDSSVSWNSVSWNSVSWNSVSWNSVSWNSVSWNSDYWGN